MRTSLVWSAFAAILVSAMVTAPVRALDIDKWLVAGPVEQGHIEVDEDMEMEMISSLLSQPPVDPYDFWPFEGDKFSFGPNNEVQWRGSDGFPDASDANGTQWTLLATYLDAPAWQTGELSIASDAPFSVFLDGEEVAKRATVKAASEAETKDVVLDQGHNRLLIITALPADADLEQWNVEINYVPDDEYTDWIPDVTLDPVHPYDIIDYYRMDLVSNIEISPDGKWVALDLGRRDRKTDKVADRVEVWDTVRKTRVWQYRTSSGVGNIKWAPDSNRLLFKVEKDLFVWNRAENAVEKIDDKIEGHDFRWAPDGNGLYYLHTIEAAENDEPYQVMWGLRDRWSGWRNNIGVHHYAFDGGVDTPLLAMEYKPEDWDISANGEVLVFARTLPDPERPFERMDLLVYNVLEGTVESAYQGRFQRDEYARIAVSPDGKQVAFSAPAKEVEGNEAVVEINSSHHALWVLDIESGQARRIDPSFEPSIDIYYYSTGSDNAFDWHADDYVAFSAIYMRKVYFCTWQAGSDKIEKTLLTTPGFSDMDFATGPGSHTVVYKGDRYDDFSNIHVYNTKRGNGDVLVQINQNIRKLTQPAPRIESYDYVNAEGDTIYGYLYWPRGYDPEKSYPMTVDTYGGVLGFGDSWLWMPHTMANRGYFVYVPIPRGATGFGQEYADYHVNEWGEITSRDMNNGVRHVIENVPGVDPARVGFVSGSYGGFLAMYLLSMPKDHPDYYPYATAISDYGISNLASYWGIGHWGVFYSEKATAGNFPWNNPEFYIEHSPLYQADKITEPLLLIHGEDDVNVPSGESEQMYSALKVLDRDVVYVRFPGEGHGCASTRATYLTSKKLHIEWFDKHLRNRPGAWEKRMEDEMLK